jgi:DNA-binding response OmpR family regulator
MRVLIIDDEAYLRFCTTILSADGHDVVASGTFERAADDWPVNHSRR